MDKAPLISFLVITRNRSEYLRGCIKSIVKQDYRTKELIVVDNNSRPQHLSEARAICSDIAWGTLVEADQNLGVAGGRNLASARADGDVLVGIDDDAHFKSARCAQRIVARFAGDDRLGALAFRVEDYKTSRIQKTALPVSASEAARPAETTQFIGAGHAIRRELFNRLDGYREFGLYGHEEVDLSLRIVDAGYDILYDPKIIVGHERTGAARTLKTGSTEFWANHLEKRIAVATMNLPWRYVVSTAVIRSLYVLYRTRGNVAAPVKACVSSVRAMSFWLARRRLISDDGLERLRSLGASLWY